MVRYLSCLQVKDEGGVPLLGGVPLVGPPSGRRRGGWQMRRVLLVEDHATLVLDQTLPLVERGDDGETE